MPVEFKAIFIWLLCRLLMNLFAVIWPSDEFFYIRFAKKFVFEFRFEWDARMSFRFSYGFVWIVWNAFDLFLGLAEVSRVGRLFATGFSCFVNDSSVPDRSYRYDLFFLCRASWLSNAVVNVVYMFHLCAYSVACCFDFFGMCLFFWTCSFSVSFWLSLSVRVGRKFFASYSWSAACPWT